MKQRLPQFILGLLIGLALAPSAARAADAEGRITAPSEPLLALMDSGGWSAGLQYTADSRELKARGELVELDAGRVVAELGYEVAPFLQLAAQAGWISADLDDGDGENGLAWAAIARLNLVDYILHDSPVVGRQEWLGAGVEIQYRHNESNQDQADLEWQETRVVPSVYYFRNHRGDALRKTYQATGYGLHGGLAFSGIEGDFGTVEVEENRNFGFVLGGDLRWRSGWTARVRATVYGSGDQTLEIGTQFNF